MVKGLNELKGTFGALAEQWLSEIKPRLKPSTSASYGAVVRTRLLPTLGQYPLKRITPSLIESLITGMSKAELAPRTVNGALTLLRLMLKVAVKKGYLAANPGANVEKLRVPHKEMRVLTPLEIRALIEASRPGYQRLFVLLAVHTGARRGELIGLKWQDVDWEGRRLNIRRVVWKKQFYEPKSRTSTRSIDLTRIAYDALRNARPAGTDEEIAEKLLFPSKDGGPRHGEYLSFGAFKGALKRGGLPMIRFHDLRHTYASLLIAAKIHPKEIQTQMGHSSITITLDVYGHLMPDPNRHASERLGEILGMDTSDDDVGPEK